MVKKFMAVLLAGCLTLQPFTGAVVQAADFTSGPEIIESDPAPPEAADPPAAEEPSPAEPDIDVFVPPDQSESTEGQETLPPGEMPEISDTEAPETAVPDEPDTPDSSGTPDVSNPDPSVPGDSNTDNPELPNGEEGPFDDEAQTGPEEDLEEEPSVPAQPGTGTIQVTLISMLPFKFNDEGEEGINVKVIIDGTEKQARISGKAGSQTVSFDGLQPGDHLVTVKANKFGTYTQTVSVGSNTINKIEVATANVETGVSARPGWLCLGDITGDGNIDANDAAAMLSQIRSGEYNDSANLATSIAEEGVEALPEKIDIVDLQYLVNSMNEKHESSVTKMYVPPKEAVKVPDGTKEVDPAEIQSVLNGEEGSLSLETANDAPISPENPVGIEFSLSESNEEAPVIEGITIETPVVVDDSGNMSSNIADGTVEYTYVEGGEEKTGYIIIGNGQIPSVSPTPETSPTPEVSPSVSPEASPSVSPEALPTASPEASPTTSPEAEPTVSPEALPTASPEASPTTSPEASPTTSPEVEPTDTPETSPTVSPEEAAPSPEAHPTETPVEDPSAEFGPGMEDVPDADTEVFTPDESQEAPQGEESSAFAALLSFIFPLKTVHAEEISPSVSFGEDGSLIIDFGTQVAVKKVSIRITGTKKNENLVDIAKVEFVNDMDQKIPAPELSVPELSVSGANNEEFTVSWTPQNNITGYDLFVQGPVKKESGIQTQIIRIAETTHTVTMINDKPVKNFEAYTVKVRSVNGDWTSPWSDAVTATPRPTTVPAPPDNVVVKTAYRAVNVSWKMMDDAEGYMVYYREKKEEDAGSAPAADGSFMPVVDGFEQAGETGENAMEGLLAKGMLTKNSFTIDELEDGTSYFIYVVGWNACGWGTPSIVTEGSTNGGDVPRLPEYHLINKSDEIGKVSPVIIQALHGNHGSAKMHNSPIDEQNADISTDVQHTYWAYGTVDNNYESYWEKPDEWDDGISYLQDNYARGITITLDKAYKMSYLTFTAANLEEGLNYARVLYWNSEHDTERQEVKADLISRTDENQNPYYIVRFHEPISAQRIMLCLGTGWRRINMRVGEIHFHSYSDIEGKIYALYEDEMHSQLADGVSEEYIQSLEDELDVPDPETQEMHPLYEYLKLELQNARNILAMEDQETYQVETGITQRKDGALNYSGLNSWQPLGKVVYAGEKIIVFVGHNFKKVGEQAEVNLVFTQFHAESNALCMTKHLKVGKNEFEVPRITNSSYEKGGQIYVEYTGNSNEDRYGIRVQGGVEIPTLNLYHKDDAQKTAAISEYITELKEYVNTIQTKHGEIHTQHDTVNFEYKEQDCILNATDIMMDYMMYSVPATQVIAGLRNQGGDEVTAMKTSLDAMEKTMILFYQHKGLTDLPGNTENGGNNRLTARHLNIRYMRMFAGAFMYASGNHIGIEYPQTTIASGAGSWDSFGWGIAHEIGHDINDSRYAIAEITNNYFAQLLTAETGGTRFKYPDVYRKVTSGEIGRSSDGAVQLALYWQLHLAFDPQNDRHIFDDYNELFNSLFFARVDTYSRNPGNAPEPLVYNTEGGQVNLLDGGVDQNLMRLSCAAAEANILPFFERWGMVPDETTREYAQLYGDPTVKALYYANEKARGGMRKADAGITGQDVVTASVKAEGQYAELTISSSVPAEQILGYEIIRGTYTDGSLHKEVVGFAPCAESGNVVYTDRISTMNNRVMYYEVKAVDTGFNYSNPASAGSVKIETSGALNKENWAIETDNITSDEDSVPIQPDINDPDRGFNLQQNNGITHLYPHTADRIIDGDRNTAYAGQTSENASIVIDLKTVKEVTSLIYYGSDIPSAEVDAGVPDGEGGISWVQAKKGDLKNGQTLWFNPVNPAYSDRWIGTYDAQYLCIKIPANHAVTINEIDICGPTGDNVEFGLDPELSIPTVGILTADYEYAEGYKIPKDSLVFIGKYKGNPAFNVVILYDEEGNVVGVKDGSVASEQIILAPDPGEGHLGETNDGTWVYYIEPDSLDLEGIKQIKRVRAELYRVDEAHTLAGERVVSDTVFFDMPEGDFPAMTLAGGKIPGTEKE